MQTDGLRDVDITQVSHLAQLCNTTTGKVGCDITKVYPRHELLPMSSYADKRHLTPAEVSSQYIDVIVAGKRLRGMYDTGSNVTLLAASVAKQLNLPILPYPGTFR